MTVPLRAGGGWRASARPGRLVALAETTAETVRRLEDKGLVHVGPQISERDPYAREQILPTTPLRLRPRTLCFGNDRISRAKSD